MSKEQKLWLFCVLASLIPDVAIITGAISPDFMNRFELDYSTFGNFGSWVIWIPAYLVLLGFGVILICRINYEHATGIFFVICVPHFLIYWYLVFASSGHQLTEAFLCLAYSTLAWSFVTLIFIITLVATYAMKPARNVQK